MLRFLLICLGIIWAVATCDVPLWASASGGVPQAVWQDNERNHRRSPPQIKQQLLQPQVRAAKFNMPENAQSERQAKSRNLVSQNAVNILTEPLVGQDALSEDGWRLKVSVAAVANNEMVLLGDIANPLGNIDKDLWESLKVKELWPAPKEEGKPLLVNRSRLSTALRQALGPDISSRCILPTSLAIQRGGIVLTTDALRSYVVKSLAAQLQAMPGDAELTDFRLPDYIFLSHPRQQVQLEVGKLSAGRVPLKFAVQEADGTVLRRLAGLVNLTLWVTIPAAARVLGKGEALVPENVTFIRVDAGKLKDLPWDGKGGPWQVVRSINTGEPILQSDLASQLMVKRGAVVDLIYSKGNLRMTTKAEALSDGAPGETISVRNLQTKKQVFATVKDGNTVEIH